MAREGCVELHHTCLNSMWAHVMVERIIGSLYPRQADFIETITHNYDM